MKSVFYYSLIFFSVLSIACGATHIVGGEMNYRYLGNDNYEITLTVYRDCYNGQAPFDDPAAIGIFDGSGNLYANPHVSLSFQQNVPNAINSPCVNAPSTICYEVAQYIFTENLPPGNGSYTITHQRCCRNYTVMNIANIQNTGATYTAVIPDASASGANSNPVFNDWPPTFICKDAPFTFDHSATDAEGDSLVYELSYPYEGGDQVNRAPDPPSAPPYIPVSFINPYSVNNPLGGVAMQINASTGELKATPNNEGQYLYGITVKEYRNGIYLSETRRDFQVNVITCPQLTVASIYSPTISCGSLNANFQNNSYNGASYLWDFGDLSTNSDTSSQFNPVYTYPDTGTYFARLIAISPIDSLCNDTSIGIVHMYPEFLAENYVSNLHCSNVFSFYDQSFGLSGNSTYWHWDFGDGSVATDPNPVHTYSQPGEYTVTMMTSADSSCLDTLYRKIHVLVNPVASFSVNLDTCTYSIVTDNSSVDASGYRWDITGRAADYASNLSIALPASGNYLIRLIATTDSSCVDTFSTSISIPPLPVPEFDYRVDVCDSNVQFWNLSQHAIHYQWDFGDANSFLESPTHIFSVSGNVPVSLTAESVYGCEVTLKKDIFFISRKKAHFDSKLDSCSGFFSFYNVTKGAAFYRWDFGDGSFSTEKEPSYRFKKDGEQIVTLTLNSESQCADSISKTVSNEAPLGEKVFIPNSFTPNGDGINDFFSMSVFRPCDTYSLSIFNRWGQKVFQADDASGFSWDGTFAGERLPMDVYVYILENDFGIRQGTITILR